MLEKMTDNERGDIRRRDRRQNRVDDARTIAQSDGKLHRHRQCRNEYRHRPRQSDAGADVIHPLPRLVALMNHLDLKAVFGKRVLGR